MKFRHSWCSKCPPCSRTYDQRHERPCLIAQSMICWSNICHSSISERLHGAKMHAKTHAKKSVISRKRSSAIFKLKYFKTKSTESWSGFDLVRNYKCFTVIQVCQCIKHDSFLQASTFWLINNLLYVFILNTKKNFFVALPIFRLWISNGFAVMF